MNNINNFASLIKGDWGQRSTDKAGLARNAQIKGLFFKSANKGWRFWTFSIQTQDLCSDFTLFLLLTLNSLPL